MLKRLPILCAMLLALAACGKSSDDRQAPAMPAVSTTAVAPAASRSATGTAAASTTAAPAAASAPRPSATGFVDDGRFVAGKDYQRIEPQQSKVTDTPKIEVVDVFSYGCPACNAWHATIEKLAKELPSEAVMVYLPASFMVGENWPLLQRAYYTAQALGVADQADAAMYDAVWKTQELSALNASGNGLKPLTDLPKIEDVAKIYARFGADPVQFVAVSGSFAINTKMKRADELVRAYGVPGTPSLVVDGKYRVDPHDAGSPEKTIEVIKWLVAKEAAGQ